MPVVLVVDDSQTARAMLVRQLAANGFTVHEAVDGEEALESMRARPPDVLLLDVEMPKLDGYGVLKAMKEDRQLDGIPVVFVTGRMKPEDVAEGLRLGAHDYLRKPFEEIELVARVGSAARLKALQDELRTRNAELLEVSRLDPLTGLFNRRHLEEQLPLMASSAVRHGQPLGAILMDVDHFKEVNDTHGHEAGDGALKAIADRLKMRLRMEDLVGRWGGEEFLILLTQTGIDGVVVLAESLRLRIAIAPIELGNGSAVKMTASFGCAVALDRDHRGLLRRADEALYEAKAAGRNSVAFAE